MTHLVHELSVDVMIDTQKLDFFINNHAYMYFIRNWILKAFCLQAKEETELPEYILGAVRLNRLRPDSAVHFEV